MTEPIPKPRDTIDVAINLLAKSKLVSFGAVRKVRKLFRSTRAATIGDVYRILAALVALFFLTGDRWEKTEKWLGWDMCALINPNTGRPDKNVGLRRCIPGRVTYVRWTDPTRYGINNVVDKPNRILQVDGVDENGLIAWNEITLYYDRNGREHWEKEAHMRWVSVPGGQSIPKWIAFSDSHPVDPNTLDLDAGFILRRTFVADDGCKNKKYNDNGTAEMLEFFIENKVRTSKYDENNPGIYGRFLPVPCGSELGYSLRVGEKFRPMGIWLSEIRKDN